MYTANLHNIIDIKRIILSKQDNFLHLKLGTTFADYFFLFLGFKQPFRAELHLKIEANKGNRTKPFLISTST